MQIFIHTLARTFDKKNWKWLGGIPGIVTIIGVIQPNLSLLRSCLFSWIPFIWDNALTDSLILFFCALLIWAFACMTYYLAKYFWEWVHNVYVDSVWANTIVDLATAYSCIHELERKGIQLTEEKVAFALSEFCDQIKTIFDRKTHSDCCVSIKVPIANYNASDHWECIHVTFFYSKRCFFFNLKRPLLIQKQYCFYTKTPSTMVRRGQYAFFANAKIINFLAFCKSR